MQGQYPVITLCGSTRFKNEFLEVQKRLTLKGAIVISLGLFGHSGDSEVLENTDEETLTKTLDMLDDMHRRKIDMADEIFVINVGGYIGDSTRSEIDYAKAHGKRVNYLEPVNAFEKMSENAMSNEQWTEDGICSECRRKNHCSKPCKANKDRTKSILYGAVVNKFLSLGYPEEIVNKGERMP